MIPPATFDIRSWANPGKSFSQCPFWFWNDALDAQEIRRQIGDFQNHGVDAFVIHPRIGLPHSLTWLGDELFEFYRVALAEAKRRGMWVMLYDEGMYPSGSAAGLVVQTNPEFQARGLVCVKCDEAAEGLADATIVTELQGTDGFKYRVYERKVDAVIRGLHYLGDEAGEPILEEEHAAADLLNPRSVECFINLVYERFYKEFGEYFGKTIRAIFTDEPNPLGRLKTPGAMPGTVGIVEYVSSFAGYDFESCLLSLWQDDEPEAARHRAVYDAAIAQRLNETYYEPLAIWCAEHGVALTGHPARPDDIENLRHFQIPGQDIVWRDIEPDKASALEGPPSTMAKAASSVAFHSGRNRNMNEFAGAYGKSLTFEELQWLASWVMIRGCDMLVPHAFYYSMRGPRADERPPDVGPNSPWWNEYKLWADMTRRICWLNAVGNPVCRVAIVGSTTALPWRAAKACFENQIDFHYISPHDLAVASVRDGKLKIGFGLYDVVITEEGFSPDLPVGTRELKWNEAALGVLKGKVSPVVCLDKPAQDLRCRHLMLANKRTHLLMLFNEGRQKIERQISAPVSGAMWKLDPATGKISEWSAKDRLELGSHKWLILLIES